MNDQSEVREEILRKLAEIEIPAEYELLYTADAPPGKPVHGISRWNLLLRGTVEFLCCEKGRVMRRELSAPAIYYCTAGGYQWLSADDAERRALSFCYYGDFIRVVWADTESGILYYHTAEPLSPGGFKLIAALETLYAEKSGDIPLKPLLSLLFQVTRRRIAADPGAGRAVINRRWALINEFLRAHRFEKLSRAAVAALFQLSPGSLSRLARQNTGTEFSLLRLHYRLESAAELLSSTMLPLKEIAASCGFVHTSYFHRCFLARYGLTPGRYRNRCGAAADEAAKRRCSDR